MGYGTIRTQIVMDYDDFTKVMEEFADKVANKVLEITKAEYAAHHLKEQDELMTAKQVRAIMGVTDKTLHVWGKTGFLPRIRIGGVVRYRRADVERVSKVKGVD